MVFVAQLISMAIGALWYLSSCSYTTGRDCAAERGENKGMKWRGLGTGGGTQSPLNFLCSLRLVRPPPLSEILEQAIHV